MSKIINLKNYSNKKDNRIRSYSIIDIILDPKKKREIDDYCDRTYTSTKEEDEIFNEMRNK